MQIHMSDRRDCGKCDRKAKGNHQNGKDKPWAHDAASRTDISTQADLIDNLVGRKTQDQMEILELGSMNILT
jgi:hypothetical protein